MPNLGYRSIPETLRADWLNRIRKAQDHLSALENSLLDVLEYEPQECECPACEMGERGHEAYVAQYEARTDSPDA